MYGPCLTPITLWNFPALTTMHLSQVALCDNTTRVPVDLFSKCVNLRNLTLKSFNTGYVDVFDIVSPLLSYLILIDGRCTNILNLITPQLEHLTINNCEIRYLKAPPGLSSFFYRNYRHHPLRLPKDCFHSLNKVSIYIHSHSPNGQYKEEDACEMVNMLQEIHSARFLTLHIDIVECISAFPGLLSHHPSPFSNLTCLIIDTIHRKDAYNFKISTEARNFLLENSPSATLIMELPEAPPTRAMRQKEARVRNAKLVAEVESHMKELQASLEQGKTMIAEIKQEKGRAFATFRSITAELSVLAEKKMTQREQWKKSVDLESQKGEMQMQVDEEKTLTKNKTPQIDLREEVVESHKEEMQMINVEQSEVPIDGHKAEMQMQVDEEKTLTDNKTPQIDLREEVVEGHKEEMQMIKVGQSEVPIDGHKAEMQLHGGKEDANNKDVRAGLLAQIWPCVEKIQYLTKQEDAYVKVIISKEYQIRILLEKLPKRRSANIEECYSQELGEAKSHRASMVADNNTLSECVTALSKALTDLTPVPRRKLHVPSQATGS